MLLLFYFMTNLFLVQKAEVIVLPYAFFFKSRLATLKQKLPISYLNRGPGCIVIFNINVFTFNVGTIPTPQ